VSENPTEGRLSKKGKLMQNTTKAQELTAAIIKNDETKHKLGESSSKALLMPLMNVKNISRSGHPAVEMRRF
jgi:hypothetical protein